MPFIGAFIAAAVGATGFAAMAIEAAVAIGVALGAQKLLGSMAAKPQTAGAQLRLRIDPNAPRQIVIGRQANAGSLAYWGLSGSANKWLDLVIAVADREIAAIEQIYVARKPVTWNPSTGAVAEYPNMTIKAFTGAAGQTANTSIVDRAEGRWSADHVGVGVAHVDVYAGYRADLYPSGIPELLFIVKGARLYDPRYDTTAGGSGSQRWSNPATWAWSDNPAVVIYNIIRGFWQDGEPLFGLFAPAEAIVLADYFAAANACDESVSLAGGGSEPRYRCNAVIDCKSDDPLHLIESLSAAMAGSVFESAGMWRIQAGVSRAPVAAITDADLIVDQPFVSTPRLPLPEIVNAVTGSYCSPDALYDMAPLPPRVSPADEASDGGQRRAKDIELATVTSPTQAQRIMEMERRRARRMLRVSCTLRSRWCVLEPGDVVAFSSARRGYVARWFEIESARVRDDLNIVVTMREIDDAVDDWAPSDEIASTESTDLPSAGPPTTSISGLALATATVSGSGGAQRAGLSLSWTPIDDATVDRLAVEYRKQGDATAHLRYAADPSAGVSVWVDGVQGGIVYEARARMETTPERASDWTSWVATAGQTVAVVVDEAALAAVAQTVPPGSLTPDRLDAQSQLELTMATAVSDIEASVAARMSELDALMQQSGRAALGGIVIGETGKRQIRALRDDVDGLSASVTEVIDVQAGHAAQWTMTVSVYSGAQWIDGMATIGATDEQSFAGFLVDNFFVGKPGTSGGDPLQLLTVGTRADGSTGIVLNGPVYAPGSIHAGALIADSITTLYVTDPTGTYYYDFVNGKQGRTDGTFTIDAKNGLISIISPAQTDFGYGFNAVFATTLIF